MFSKLFNLILSLISFFIIFISCFFIPIFSKSYNINFKFSKISKSTNNSIYKLSENGFIWPTPGYTRITSNFGKRVSPTSGASSYHSGIDIGAPTGTNIISICSGKVIYTGFKGAGRIYINCRK